MTIPFSRLILLFCEVDLFCLCLPFNNTFPFIFLYYQDKRLGALNRFKAKDCNILICTDVASRGLDIQGVDMVINYDIPMNSKVSFCLFEYLSWAIVISF